MNGVSFVSPFVDKPPAGLVVGREAVVSDDFEGGEVAEFAVAIFADSVDDDFNVVFGDVASFDVGEGTAHTLVIFFGEFGEGLEEKTHRGEF